MLGVLILCCEILLLLIVADWGERNEPHTCGVNGKLSVYLFIGASLSEPHTSESNGAIFIYYYYYYY